MSDYRGPTVVEAAEARIRQINRMIEDLQDERKMLQGRIRRYEGSKVLEAERAATAAEPYQRTQLPE